MDLILDVETTTFEKGNPFARRNRLCYVGAYNEGSSVLVGTDAILPYIAERFVSASRLVGFNIKFDLHWFRRYGIVADNNRRIWDCQLAHFLLGGQKTPYPSLDEVCVYYGLPGKDDTLKRKYGWPEGNIDTPDIPQWEMQHYLKIDLERTYQVYVKQQEDFTKNPQLYKLFQLQCRDLLVLADMEWNGLMLDIRTARQRAEDLNDEILEIEQLLSQHVSGIPVNWDSTDHLSCFLYGGIIKMDRREVIGVYKSGVKIGEPRYRVFEDEYPLPRLFEPIPRSELKKEGYYSTDESILRQLTKSPIIDLLLERSAKCKLRENLVSLCDINEKKDWPENELHGQFNQCVAQTGRLSSSQPNQQNFPDEVKELIKSRYENN